MSHRWKMLVAVAVALLVLTGVVMISLHYQPQSEVEAYKKSLFAKGEKLEISQVLPPTVPPEENGADAVRAAFALITPGEGDYTNLPPAMFMVLPGKAMIGWAQPDVRGYYTSYYTNTWENVKAGAEANRPVTELLRQVMDYPTIDFQPDYSKWPDIPLEHLAPLRRCALKLLLATMCNLHEGDAASALTNLCTMLALVQGTHDEWTILSQHERKFMASIATVGTWELLQSTNVTDVQLASLQRSWEWVEFIKAAENSFLMERAGMELAIQKMRVSNEDFNRFTGISRFPGRSGTSASGDWLEVFKRIWVGTKLAGVKFLWRSSWTYSDELQALRGDQIVLESMRMIETNQFFNPVYTNMLNQLQALGITNDPDAWFLQQDIPDFRQLFSEVVGTSSAAVTWTMAAEASRRIGITAIALKRFQLKHGSFPEKLSELTPEFLPKAPLDPVDGRPLCYRRNADGTYLLYSVGENGRDDGGDLSLETGFQSSNYSWQRPHALDWVWPQPATPEEIQNFYKHPPK